MSIKLMSKVWDSGEEQGVILLIWLALADSANDEGLCWPSIATVAKKCRISNRHATRIIGKLKLNGRLKTLYRSGQSTIYKIFNPQETLTPESQDTPTPEPQDSLEQVFEDDSQDTPTPDSLVIPEQMFRDDSQITPAPDSLVIPPLTPESPRTVIEPSIEPGKPAGFRALGGPKPAGSPPSGVDRESTVLTPPVQRTGLTALTLPIQETPMSNFFAADPEKWQERIRAWRATR